MDETRCLFCGALADHTMSGWRCADACERHPSKWVADDPRPIIYLGGSKTGQPDSGMGWRNDVADRWAWAARFALPNLVPNHGEGLPAPHAIVRHDLALIRNADAYLWNADLPSPGSAMEAFYARRETVALLVFVESHSFRQLSPWEQWFIEGDPNTVARSFQARTVDEGVAWIVSEHKPEAGLRKVAQ